MTVYVAWDGNEYPAPPPEGWYQAADGRWWPEGYGPGPAAEPSTVAEDLLHRDHPVEDPIPASTPAASGPVGVESAPAPRRLLVIIAAAAIVMVGAVVALVLSLSGDDAASPTSEVATVPPTTATTAPTTTSGSADEETTTTPPPPGSGLSLSTALDLGEAATLRYLDISEGEDRVWSVEVIDAARDRTDDVLAENQFNTPPDGEARFVMAGLRVTYEEGPELGSLFDLNFSAVGPSGVVRTTFDPSCGVIPDGLDPLTDVVVGTTVEGTVCWVVEPGDLGSLTMILEAFLDDQRLFLSLQ